MTAEELERRIVAAGYHVTLSGCVDCNTAAAALEFSPRTLVAMRQEGTGPEYERLNGRIWYPVAALAAFLNTAERITTDAARRKRRQPAP